MIPPQTTRVPAVIDALVALAKTIPGMAADAVLDGPPAFDPKMDVIAFSYGEPGVIVTSPRSPGYGQAFDETVHVVSSIWSWSGSVVYKPRRDRCADLLNQLRVLIDANPTLSGACDLAEIGPDQEWLPKLTDRGCGVSVGFTVQAMSTI